MVFTTKTELEEHDESHSVVSSQCSEAKCNKCEKVYSNISKLRRHDWRAHREISCNICDELLQSREEISIHRQTKHQMFRKKMCTFFPECMDEDECFFQHPDIEKRRSRFCPDGEHCVDQACSYSDANHMKSNAILCRFQVNCNRLSCSYKHVVERKAFLGGGLSNTRGK